MTRLNYEYLVDCLSDLMKDNFQTYIDRVNAYATEPLIPFNPDAVYSFDMPNLMPFAVSYNIDLTRPAQPVSIGSNAADRITFGIGVLINANLMESVRKIGFRYCDAMKLFYKEVILKNPLFQPASVRYLGDQVTPPVTIGSNEIPFVCAVLEFSVDLPQ